MNEGKHLRDILDRVAAQDMPQGTDLWPRLQQAIGEGQPRRAVGAPRLVWVVAILLIGLVLISSAGVAAYRLLTDAGLISVEQAGLISELGTPARFTPAADYTGAAVAATVDWAYADENRLSFGLTIEGLAPPVGVYVLDMVNQVELEYPGGEPWSGALEYTAAPIEGREDAFQLTITQVQAHPAQSELAVVGHIRLGDRETMSFPAEPSPENPPQEITIPAVGELTFEFSVPVREALVVEPNLTQVAKGISMRLERVKLTPSYAEARICFDPAGEGFWQPHAVLQIGDLEPAWSEGDASAGGCTELRFAGAFVEAMDGALKMTMRVDYLQQPQPPSEALYRRAQQRLADQGIQFEYSVDEGGGGWSVETVPPGMTNEELNRRVLLALEEIVEGPWVFQVEMP